MANHNKTAVFFHVPRSGGTYIIRQMLQISTCPVNRIKVNLQFNDPYYREIQNKANKQTLLLSVESEGFIGYKDILSNIESDKKHYIVLRDPFKRAYSLFNYLTSSLSKHEPTHGAYSKFSCFEDYITSDKASNHWLVRNILNIHQRIITEDDYNTICGVFNELKMNTYDISDIDKCVESICEYSGLTYRNLVVEYINASNYANSMPSLEDLDIKCKTKFLKDNQFEIKLYEKYCKLTQTN